MPPKRQKTTAPSASSNPPRRKRPRTVTPPQSLPTSPTDTPYTATLRRIAGSTALKLYIERERTDRASKSITLDDAYFIDANAEHVRCDHIQDPTESHIWHRGDIGEIETTDGTIDRVLVLDIFQEKATAPAEAAELDTFFAVVWLYTPDEGEAAGIKTKIELGPGKTHVISTHAQILRFGGFDDGPMSAEQRQREVVEDQVLDFNARPRRTRPLASADCVVAAAIEHFHTSVRQQPITPPPEYDSDDSSEHATPLDPRLSSPLVVAPTDLDDEHDDLTANSNSFKQHDAAQGSVLQRLQQSISAMSPFRSK